MQTIELAPLGILNRETQYKNIYLFKSQPLSIPYLNGISLSFTVSGGKNPSKIDTSFTEAISNFLTLTIQNRKNDTPKLYTEYLDWFESLDLDEPYANMSRKELSSLSDEERSDIGYLSENDKDDIWQYIEPKSIMATLYKGDDYVTLEIIANCAWTDEHYLKLRYPYGKFLQEVVIEG